jgi:hypothetical protein
MSVNSALHTMAAHLHRYKAEMRILSGAVMEIYQNAANMCQSSKCTLNKDKSRTQDHDSSFRAVNLDIKALEDFISELEIKTDTVIALVRFYAMILAF